jgi:N-acetylglucosamine-6-phosphate deacetylase
MTALWFENVRSIRPGEEIAPGRLLVEDGTIARVNPPADACPPDATRIDGGGRLLGPGLIDLHTHGIAHYQFDSGPESLAAGAKILPSFGVTCMAATIVPKARPDLLEHLATIADALPGMEGAQVPGLHLEGPFVALPGAGCDTVPGDVGFLGELLGACRGRVLAMSISPDTPNILPVIERLHELGIAIFITHTAANAEQAQAAIDAGAHHATHFYDVFPLPEQTEPGVRPVGMLEAIYANPSVTVDFIADGVHVHPLAIRAALAAKGFQGISLITDSNIGAGLPEGLYDTPWGYPVYVKPGNGARIAGDHPHKGVLAGSALTMNVGIANLLDWLKLPPAQVWAMGTANPARCVGLTRKGLIADGMDADLVLWNDDLTPAGTWVMGKQVYQSSEFKKAVEA